jgi:hypothetical protein
LVVEVEVLGKGPLKQVVLEDLAEEEREIALVLEVVHSRETLL